MSCVDVFGFFVVVIIDHNDDNGGGNKTVKVHQLIINNLDSRAITMTMTDFVPVGNLNTGHYSSYKKP